MFGSSAIKIKLWFARQLSNCAINKRFAVFVLKIRFLEATKCIQNMCTKMLDINRRNVIINSTRDNKKYFGVCKWNEFIKTST